MRPEFWRDRWSCGQIGFHQADVESYLKSYWFTLEIAENAAIFVPLCGKTLDLMWLCATDHNVIGVELSDLAVEAFCMENGLPARRRATPSFDAYETSQLTLLCGDYFDLTRAHVSNAAAIYDRAALISWFPKMRARYVNHLTAITDAGAQTLLITLEYPQSEFDGPPFSVDANEVERLYSRTHEIQELARRDILASEPRLRAKGVSQLFEACYRLVRR